MDAWRSLKEFVPPMGPGDIASLEGHIVREVGFQICFERFYLIRLAEVFIGRISDVFQSKEIWGKDIEITKTDQL